MKRSMHEAIASALGVPLERVAYLDDTGHMSGVDPLLALDRAVRAGDVARRRSRPAARRRYRLHLGGEHRTLGPAGGTPQPRRRRAHPDERIHGVDRKGARADGVVRGRPGADRASSREATGDHQWIHVDPVRAADGPFGTTIAHGFLTLSLLRPADDADACS